MDKMKWLLRYMSVQLSLSTSHLRMVLVDEESTKTKEIGPVVEEQEVQQFFDVTDGPSKFTDPAVSFAPDLTIDWSKSYIG